MAKATVVRQVTSIKLELTQDEAEMLKSLLGQCASQSTTTPVYEALRDAGIESTYNVTTVFNQPVCPLSINKKA